MAKTYSVRVKRLRNVMYLKFCNPRKNHSTRKTFNIILEHPIKKSVLYSNNLGIKYMHNITTVP